MNLRNTLLSCGFLLSSICAYAGTPDTGAIVEPYPQLTGKPTGARQPYSPDPLVRYRWDSPAADDDLEVYTLKPLSVKADKPEAIRHRLEVYKASTEPLIGYYKEKGLLVDIDASVSPEEVLASIIKAVNR